MQAAEGSAAVPSLHAASPMPVRHIQFPISCHGLPQHSRIGLPLTNGGHQSSHLPVPDAVTAPHGSGQLQSEQLQAAHASTSAPPLVSMGTVIAPPQLHQQLPNHTAQRPHVSWPQPVVEWPKQGEPQHEKQHPIAVATAVTCKTVPLQQVLRSSASITHMVTHPNTRSVIAHPEGSVGNHGNPAQSQLQHPQLPRHVVAPEWEIDGSAAVMHLAQQQQHWHDMGQNGGAAASTQQPQQPKKLPQQQQQQQWQQQHRITQPQQLKQLPQQQQLQLQLQLRQVSQAQQSKELAHQQQLLLQPRPRVPQHTVGNQESMHLRQPQQQQQLQQPALAVARHEADDNHASFQLQQQVLQQQQQQVLQQQQQQTLQQQLQLPGPAEAGHGVVGTHATMHQHQAQQQLPDGPQALLSKPSALPQVLQHTAWRPQAHHWHPQAHHWPVVASQQHGDGPALPRVLAPDTAARFAATAASVGVATQALLQSYSGSKHQTVASAEPAGADVTHSAHAVAANQGQRMADGQSASVVTGGGTTVRADVVLLNKRCAAWCYFSNICSVYADCYKWYFTARRATLSADMSCMKDTSVHEGHFAYL